VTDVKTIINNHLTNVIRSNTDTRKRIPIEQVDSLADELVAEYGNPEWRGWYCGLINKFGIARILDWQKRARSGSNPSKLFSTYAKQAGGYRSKNNER